MNDVEKIIRINAFIQRGLGSLYLDGKEVMVVSLDRSYVIVGDLINEPLTDEQLEELLGQTYGKPPAKPPREESERNTHFQGFAKLLLREMFGNASDITVYTWDEEGRVRLELIIAQRIYDLFIHDRLNTGTSDLQHAASYVEAEELVNGIPDITTRFGQEASNSHG